MSFDETTIRERIRVLRSGNDIGMRLREARERAQISQNECARLLGVSVAALCRWELGNRIPKARVEDMELLLRVLEEETSGTPITGDAA